MNTKCSYIVLLIWLAAAIPQGFADAFPSRPTRALMDATVTAGTVGGNAVRERGVAVNSGQTFLPYCGRRQLYFASLQQKLESLAPRYIDHVNGPLTDNAAAFRYFTLTGWRAAARLNASGFKRYNLNGGLAGYGIAQTNDLLGQPLLDELGRALAVLRWSVRWNVWDTNVWYKGFPSETGGSFGATPAAAKSAAAAAYAADAPKAWAWPYLVPEAYSWVHRTSSNRYEAGLVRAYNTATFNFSDIGLNAGTLGLYIRGYTYMAGSAGSQIFNGQGDGVTANLSLIEEKSYTPNVKFDVIRGWPQPAWPPSNPSSDGDFNTYGYYSQYDTSLRYKGFLIKWVFSDP